MTGLLVADPHRKARSPPPSLPNTSSLIRQPSAEDLDAAHQLVSSARGGRDGGAQDERQNMDESDGQNMAISDEGNTLRVMSAAEMEKAGFISPRSQDASAKQSAQERTVVPFGQTCRLVSAQAN